MKSTKKLELGWITEGLIDFEYKKYKPGPGHARGECHRSAKLTEEKVKEICRLYATGEAKIDEFRILQDEDEYEFVEELYTVARRKALNGE